MVLQLIFSQSRVIRASTITRSENENLQLTHTPKIYFRGVPVFLEELPESLYL
ncbi:asr0102 [Nostoc sp. PCC 7120 = FACHB-418]|nr:asr0102 [Nostoc sp. PCC 7120 = FACHB-418]